MVKDAWKVSGGYLTLGWPQDTNALEDGCINDEQFISLCDSIFSSRKKVFFQQLDRFQEGVLAGIFDSLDRVQHMFTHNTEWYTIGTCGWTGSWARFKTAYRGRGCRTTGC
jgi:hypothetical protein